MSVAGRPAPGARVGAAARSARRPAPVPPALARSLASHAGGALLVSGGLAAALTALSLAGGSAPVTPASALAAFEGTLRASRPELVAAFAVVVFGAQAAGLLREGRRRDLAAARLEQELSATRLDSLRKGVDPHFLFNTLGLLLPLVGTRPEKARETIVRLGTLLRLGLRTGAQETVPLRDELRYLRCFLEIEETRLSDRLSVIVEADPGVLDAAIPPLVLKPLVEAALAAGPLRRRGPALIVLSAQRTGNEVGVVVKVAPGEAEEGGDEPVDPRIGAAAEGLRAAFGEGCRVGAVRSGSGDLELIARFPFVPRGPRAEAKGPPASRGPAPPAGPDPPPAPLPRLAGPGVVLGVLGAVLAARLSAAATGWLLVLAGLGVLGLARRARGAELRRVRLEARLGEARLAALSVQLHPHFLFNTLNALLPLVGSDPELACRTIVKLGDVLRTGLLRDAEAVVSLREEVDLLERYLEIENVRFSDRLSVAIDVEPDALEAAVPSLVLQPLVENAVKHGVARAPGPGRVVVSARRDAERVVLGVWNSLPSDEAGEGSPGEGIGLANVRERLALHHPGRSRLDVSPGDDGGFRVTLELPYVPAAAKGRQNSKRKPSW